MPSGHAGHSKRRSSRHRMLCVSIVMLTWVLGDSIPIYAIEVSQLSDPNLADERISMNFEQTDIRTVVRTIGEITGINIAIDEKVQGNVTIMSPTDIRFGDVFNVLESILQLHGYAAVVSGDLVKIVPKAEAVHHNLPVRIGTDPNEIPLDDSLITQILPLTHAQAQDLLPLVRDLLAADAKLAAHDRTNALVITDTSARIHYVATVLQELDAKENHRIFPLEHASAQAMSEHIIRILKSSMTGAPRTGRNVPTPAAATLGGLRVMPDLRTNAIVAIGTKHQLCAVADLVSELDVPRRQGVSNVHVQYLNNAQATDIADSLTKALADLRISSTVDGARSVQVTADEGTNAVILSGAPHEFESVIELIEKLDIVREQVLVEMMIVEVSQEKLTELGVDWQTINNAATSVEGFVGTNLGPRVDFVTGDWEGLSVGAYKGALNSATSIVAILTALEKDSAVNILSKPHITMQNHKQARIIVGEERAFLTDARIPGTTDPIDTTLVNSYEYKDVGITLDITPHVSQGGLVRLDIKSELTKVLTEATSPAPELPTTAKRQAETVVTMKDGSTIVIGGLIRDDTVKVNSKVPLLGDIPGLGALFRHTRDENQKTNLLMFITPHIMAGQEELVALTQEKEGVMKEVVDRARHPQFGKLPLER
ncbi:type II secretion system secretin GspD [Planctomycetota bacterium]